MFREIRVVGVSFLLQLGFLLVCSGQNLDRATLSGRIVDESESVISNVALELRNDETGHIREVASGDTGRFAIPFLSPGSYSLAAEKNGFSRLRMEGIRLTANQGLEVSLVLKVGTLATQITVTAEANRIDTASATVRHALADKELKDLPILIDSGRSVLYLLPLLVPGANSVDSLDFRDTSGRRVSINGSPVASIGFTFDGTDNYWSYSWGGGSATGGPNPDALGEFSVLTHTFKAESGNYPVIINLQTKGGSNQFHGMLRGIYRDPSLDARDFFSQNDQSGLITRAAGFQLSGPLVLPKLYRGKNRTFFFVDAERNWWRSTYPWRQPVISDAQRAGDFSQLPEDLWPKDPVSGAPFPNGRVPSNRILPQSKFFMDEFIPRASQGTEWVGTGTENDRKIQTVLRFDHQLSSTDVVNVSFLGEKSKYDFPLAPDGIAVYRGTYWGRNLTVHHTHSFSTRATNSFTFGRSLFRASDGGTGKLNNVDLTGYGFNISQDRSGLVGFPAVWLPTTGWFDPGGWTYDSEQTGWNLRNDLAFVRNNHSAKFGVDARWWRAKNFFTGNGQPWFTFLDQNPFGSSNETADLLLGIPFDYHQGSNIGDRPRRLLTSLYAQDDFKLKPNLSVNLGIRYELNGVWTDADGRNAMFRPGQLSTVFPNAPPGIIFPGDRDGLSNSAFGDGSNLPDHNNFAPRIGLAFSPDSGNRFVRKVLGGAGRTSIRAGYGIYYFPSRGFGDFAYMPPWNFAVNLDATRLHDTEGSFANPWGSSANPFSAPLSRREFNLPVQGLWAREPSLREPYQQQWTLSIQRQLPHEMTLELAYVGNRSVHIHRRFEANLGRLTPNATVFNLETRRLYPDFGSVAGYASDGSSSYNALQTRLNRRFASRFLLNAHYVWSKTMDNAGGAPSLIFDYADRDVTPWARANADRRHQFVFYGVWDLPSWKKPILKAVTSGWQTNGIVRMGSGQPLNLRNAFDSTLTGRVPTSPDLIGPYRRLDPRKEQTFRLPNGRTVTGNFLFDPSVFQTVIPNGPAEVRVGNLGRNVFTGPGTNMVDLSLLKQVRIGERHKLDFRLDARNLFNHAQFLVVYRFSQISDSGTFGRAAARTAGPRQIQLYVRYTF